jgi:hypothetical protein
MQGMTQTEPACAVPGWNFAARHQNTSKFEAHYYSAGLDHNALADELRPDCATQSKLAFGDDGRGAPQHKVVAPAFTKGKTGCCDVKFVKCLVHKNKSLTIQEGFWAQNIHRGSN